MRYMSQRINLINDQIYHIFNRGVRKNNIFFDYSDYRRWEELLYWCLHYHYSYSTYKMQIRQMRTGEGNPREILQYLNQTKRFKIPPVEILAYVHMPNHFHLILKQLVDNGITGFMHRISTSYSKYINEKYDFSGSCYQGPFKAVRAETDEQLIQLYRYIHTNPLASGLVSKRDLLDYKWSSFPSFIKGYKNKILSKKYLFDYFSKIEEFSSFTLAPYEEENIELIENSTIDDDFSWYKETRKAKKEKIREIISKNI